MLPRPGVTSGGSITVTLTADQVRRRSPLPVLPPWVDAGDGGLVVNGDRSGLRETYVRLEDDRVSMATSIADLHRASASTLPDLDPYGVSHLLNTGFVPLPATIYSRVQRLSVGDSAVLSAAGDGIRVQARFDYPWTMARSRQDQRPDPSRLLSLIVASLERQLPGANGSGILMMSSGKDSVALAVGLAELGSTNPCVTFKSGPDDHEHEHAAAICARLGLEHRTVAMPDDPGLTRSALTRFFENAETPTADHSAIGSVIAVATARVDGGAVIDGSGNDPYMGYLGSRQYRMRQRLRVRGRLAASMVRRLVRVDSPINYLARSADGALLPGRNLRPHETRRIYADAVDTDEFWYRERELTSRLDALDALAVSRIRHTEAARNNLKARLVARAAGATPVFPFCDNDLADYYFNLPAAARFDRANGVNKLLLRQLLAERIGYDPAVVGDGYFKFDGARFMVENAAFVREEIESCPLWRPEGRSLIDAWLTASVRRPFLWHALLPLFMISGWYNHSRFVGR